MCGIAGIINIDSERVSGEMLHKMNAFMRSRGPDGDGYWIDENIGLAHRRLSIIDLSDSGKQPMQDNNGNAVITYNGELYNYKVLRGELIKQNIRFTSDSDTEVIINGCLQWGVKEFLLRAEGMFAFVLYDKKNRMAYACRDRFGKKPLYYYKNHSQFIFASDIRAIKSVVNNLTIDYESLDYYLTELSMPQPKTIWNDVKQVSPAHYLTIDLNRRIIAEDCYWVLNFNDKANISVDDAIKQTENALTQAILKRTVSDVPIGCFLSGGADSGLVTAILASNSASKINTFSVGFSYDDYNELPFAEKLAKRYDTNHTSIVVDADIINDIEPIINYVGEPFADSSIIPSYYVSREIGKKVKVALSGDGGDEVFGGYYEYIWAYETDKYYRQNKSELARVIERIPNALAYKAGLTKVNYGLLKYYQSLSPDRKLYRGMGFSLKEREELYNNQALQSVKGYAERYLSEKWMSSNQLSLTDTLFESSFKTRLLNDYLVKIDRAAMMNSVEVRSPFLDHKLAELAAGMPNDIKLKGGITKYVLKKLAEKYIDPEFSKRKKMGFGIPIKYWLKKELSDFVKEVLLSESFKKRGLFNSSFVEKLVRNHLEGIEDNTHKIWALICLEMWFQQHAE